MSIYTKLQLSNVAGVPLISSACALRFKTMIQSSNHRRELQALLSYLGKPSSSNVAGMP